MGRPVGPVMQGHAAMYRAEADNAYDLLVIRRRWTLDRFGQFVTDTIAGSLLEAGSARTDA